MPRELTCFIIAPSNRKEDDKILPVVVAKDDKWGLSELPSTCGARPCEAEVLKVDFDEVYNHIIGAAIDEVNKTNPDIHITYKRGQDIEESGSILEQLIERICRADLTITDVTSNNPNVFLEYGIRLSVKDSGNLLICHERSKKRPFDIDDLRVIPYSTELKGSREAQRQIVQFILSYLKKNKDPNPDGQAILEQNRYYRSVELYTGRLSERRMTVLARSAPALIAQLAERVFESGEGGRELREDVLKYFTEYKDALLTGQTNQADLIKHLTLVSRIKGLGRSRVRDTLYELARICNADPLRKEEGARFRREAEALEDD